MEALLNVASELVALLSPEKIHAIADRIRATAPAKSDQSLHQIVMTAPARAALERLLSSWENTTIHGDVVAGVLLGASYARQKALLESTVELVWTGPTTRFVATRRTEQVLLDLIHRAERELFLVSFVAYDIPAVVDALNAANSRCVEIRILLEASTSHGGSLSVDPAATIRHCVPTALLYTWVDRLPPFEDGRVHAKVVVADTSLAFLTSANLTGHALEKNMEAGAIFVGGHIPVNLRSHLHALIETGVIHRI